MQHVFNVFLLAKKTGKKRTATIERQGGCADIRILQSRSLQHVYRMIEQIRYEGEPSASPDIQQNSDILVIFRSTPKSDVYKCHGQCLVDILIDCKQNQENLK